jgi:hypothetical protein
MRTTRLANHHVPENLSLEPGTAAIIFQPETAGRENTWRGAREAESNALEMRRTARYRGFKSHPLRQATPIDTSSERKTARQITMPRAKTAGASCFDRINRCSRTVRNRSETEAAKQRARRKHYRRNMATMVRSQNEASAFHSPRWVPTHEVIDVVRAPSNAFAAAVESSTRYKPRAKPCS